LIGPPVALAVVSEAAVGELPAGLEAPKGAADPVTDAEADARLAETLAGLELAGGATPLPQAARITQQHMPVARIRRVKPLPAHRMDFIISSFALAAKAGLLVSIQSG